MVELDWMNTMLQEFKSKDEYRKEAQSGPFPEYMKYDI